MTETEALIALNQLPVAGPVKIRRLLDNFGNAVNILKESNSSLQRIQGIGPETAKLITQWLHVFCSGKSRKRDWRR